MPDTDLADLARRYLAGCLSRPDAEAFEERLGTDQTVRDALCAAVGPLDPDPSYRRRVHRRLRPPLWRRLLAPHCYRGHPLLWGAAGAAAALLLAILLRPPSAPPAPQGPSIETAHTEPMPTAPQATTPFAGATQTVADRSRENRTDDANLASLWAGRHAGDRLTRTIAEEHRLSRREGPAPPFAVPMEKP
jgi:hypothetical protein